MTKRQPVVWTEQMHDALVAAKKRLKTIQAVADTTGCPRFSMSRLLNKEGGWIDRDTFKRLQRLKEFKKFKVDKLPIDTKENLSENLLTMIDIFDELPEADQKDLIVEALNRLRRLGSH